MIKKLKQIFCKHNFIFQDSKELGVTIDWFLEPTIHFGFEYKCFKCGKEFKKTGIFPNHKKYYPERYDKKGWPVNSDGEKMKVYN